jgi:hypothetical protein
LKQRIKAFRSINKAYFGVTVPLYDFTEFLKLSSVLNYNLSAASLNRYNVMMYIIGGKNLHQSTKADREKKGILMEALGYLFTASGAAGGAPPLTCRCAFSPQY